MSYKITTATKKIHQLSKRIRVLQGGASASKTISILLVLIDMAQRDKEPTLTSITSESYPHLKRGAMKDFLDIMELQGYFDPNRWNKGDSTYSFETGSKIEFFSLDSPHKVRGPRRDRLFINECNNVANGFETFEQLEVRTKDLIYLDYNPTSEFWVHEHVIPRDDAEFLILTYKDNEALDESIVHTIERRKGRKDWWQIYGLGQVGDGLEGRVYKGWNIIDEVPFEARLERYGLDFGYHPDPLCVIQIFYYNGGYILHEVLYRKEMLNNELGSYMKNQAPALIIADCAEPKSIAELKMYGLNIIGSKNGADSVRNGINAIRDTKISVTKTSTNLIKEYRNYLYKIDKSGNVVAGQPEDGNDHALDAMRYGMMSLVSVMKKREMNLALGSRFVEQTKRKNPAR